MESLYNKPANNFALISICNELKMKVVQFTSSKAQCVKSYDLNELIDIKSYFNRLFTLSNGGEMEIWKLDSNFDLITNKNADNIGNEHEQRIISFDILPSRKIVMTASEDQRIKIWSLNKILLCQINIFERCDCACFGNSLGDLIISHHNKLSLIREYHLNISDVEIKNLKESIKKNQQKIINFRVYFSRQNSESE